VKTVLLVDGMAYVYRAFYAIPALTTPQGLPTNAVFGFTRMLEHMLAVAVPDYLAVCFDARAPTFRHEQFAAYKAQRPPMPELLAEQLPWIKEYVGALHIALLEYPGFEADDVIGTMACRAVRTEMAALIATSDKDLCQLVQPSIAILKCGLHDAVVVDERGVVEQFGVRPDQIVDYLTLVGDSADNIPGVPGIGPKTAQALLGEHGTLDNVYAHLDALPARTRDKLREAAPRLEQVRLLLRVHCDVPVTQSFDDLAVRAPDAPRLAALRAHLNFHAPRDAAARAAPPGAPPAQQQLDLFA
jgi:DNA polymerase-1